MINDDVLLTRIGDVIRSAGTVNQTIAALVMAAINKDQDEVDVRHLRELAHNLVTLGGTVTSLGVEIASGMNEFS